MKIQVENVDAATKKIEVNLSAETVEGIRNSIFEELKKNAKIKGFRPGKVPRSIIANYYKDYISDELKKRMLQETMGEALSEAKVEPITEPIVDFIEKEDEYGYTLECEVMPDILLPEYKGREVEVETINVSEEELQNRIKGLQEMHSEMAPKEGDVAAGKGDFVFVQYQGYQDGKPLKEVKADSYPIEIGAAGLIPEFENALIGMKAGDTKQVDVPFGEDYQDKDIAGKTLLFEITVKEIKEKRIPEVNDDFAKDLGFENVAAMQEKLTGELREEKENARKKFVGHTIIDALTKECDIIVPKRLLEKQVAAMIQDAQSRFKEDKFTDDEKIELQQSMKKDFEQRALERIKNDMVIMTIAKTEGIKVEDADVEGRIKEIAEKANRPFDEIMGFYVQYNLIDNLKNGILEDKTMGFLKDNVVMKEKS